MGIHELNVTIKFNDHTTVVYSGHDRLEGVARVTFIGTNDSRTVDGGRVIYDDGSTLVLLPDSDVPDWFSRGMDVVAAHPDGSVEASFTVTQIEQPHQKYRALRD